MRVRAAVTTILLTAALGAGATACGSHTDLPATPTPSATSTTAGATPLPSAAGAALARCVAALETARAVTAPPQACAALPPSVYLKAVEASNKAGRDKLASEIASAAASDQP